MKNKKLISSLENKTNNITPIRVLYKKVGQVPEIKIINNIYNFKKFIVCKQLEILPYQNVFIIFNKQKRIPNTPINVIFDLYNIKGDLFIVQINRKKREFKSLSQEDIIWFTEDLIKKIFNKPTSKNKQIKKYSQDFITKMQFSKINENSNFENNLISVLTDINLTLASLNINNKK